MQQAYPPLFLKVWGEMACFTRPEMKVERVSYDIMTPSAARGLLQAIFWKPQMRWEIRAIHVLQPIRRISLMRNEVKNRMSVNAAMQWAKKGGAYYADEDHTQRHTLALRDVAYVIQADIVAQPGVTDDVAKFRDQFRRRAAQGQCHSTPYFGCREFVASFEISEGNEPAEPISTDLGRMLFDMDYEPGRSGQGKPRFFLARLQQGVLFVPRSLYNVPARSQWAKREEA